MSDSEESEHGFRSTSVDNAEERSRILRSQIEAYRTSSESSIQGASDLDEYTIDLTGTEYITEFYEGVARNNVPVVNRLVYVSENSEDDPEPDNTLEKYTWLVSPDESPTRTRAVSSNTSNLTDQTVVSIPRTPRKKMPPSNALKAISKLNDAAMVYEDDFQDVDPKKIPSAARQELIASAKQQSSRVREVITFFTEAPSDELFPEAKEKVADDLRKNFSKFVKVANEAEHSDKQPSSLNSSGSSSVSDEIAGERVTALEAPIAALADDVISDLKELKVTSVKTLANYKSMEAALAATEEEAKDVREQIAEMVKQASVAGNRTAVKRLDLKSIEVQTAKNKAKATLKEAGKKLGINPGSTMGKIDLKIKAPMFSGDYNEGMDYFTFATKLKDYFDVQADFCDHEKFLKLTNDCLQKTPREACSGLTTFVECMETLESIYGQPKILFGKKVAEITELGNCPKDYMLRRDWAIKVQHKLSNLHSLATKHEITDAYASTDLLSIIQESMLDHDVRELKKRVRSKRKSYGGIMPSKVELMEIQIEYLETMVDEATFEFEYNISIGGKMLSDLSKKKHSWNTRSHQAAATVANDDDEEIETDFSSVGPRSTTTAANAAAATTPMTSTPVASPNTSVYEKKDRRKAVNSAHQVNQTKDATIMPCSWCHKKHTHLSYCRRFLRTKTFDRFKQACSTASCIRCLRMDAGFSYDKREDWWRSHGPYCSDKYVCKQEICCDKEPWRQNHILLCKFHQEQNEPLKREYISSLDQNSLPPNCEVHFNSHAMYFSGLTDGSDDFTAATSIEDDVENPPIYMMQYIPGPKGEKLLAFYDSGCFGAAMSERAFSTLQSTCVRPGPTRLEVAGGGSVNIPHGDYKVHLPLSADHAPEKMAAITMLRMDQVSSYFPIWKLNEAWQDLQDGYSVKNPDAAPLPSVEAEIGGSEVDLMLGIRYVKHFPILMFSLPCGLSIYQAVLKGCNGNQGVLGGSHHSWKEALNMSKLMGLGMFLTMEMRAYNCQNTVLYGNLGPVQQIYDEDLEPLVCKVCHCQEDAEDMEVRRIIAANSPTKMIKEFQLLDEYGTDDEYRCQKCRNCYDCKNAENLEKISLKEEQEQALIEQCVTYDPKKHKVFAKLPFIMDPEKFLEDNKFVAKKVLESQLRIANKDPDLKPEIIKSHNKLRDKGYVKKIKDLPTEIQILANRKGYYIPWRCVFSLSLSTPLRLVFDASARTSSGYSLNCILAKGSNMLASLVNLLIRFRVGGSAFSADIQMAYNAIDLEPEFLQFQKYLWCEDLDPENEPEEFGIMTLIYGVKPSGNLTMTGFQKTADHADTIPELRMTGGPEVLKKELYMDDALSAHLTVEERDMAAQGLVDTLALGQMNVKAITKSGEAPSDKVSADKESVGLCGYVWHPKEDSIGLDIKPLFFGKKKRGKMPEVVTGDVKAVLSKTFTRRTLAGRVAAVYDPIGIITPITARLKVDLSEMCKLSDGWDGKLPTEHIDNWVKNLADIQLLGNVRVPRSIFPQENVDVDNIELLIAVDASQVVAIAAVYLRLGQPKGKFKCQLIAAKSKLTSKLTVPRAELKACVMGVNLGDLVQKMFGGLVKKKLFITDSTVALSWIHQDSRPLQVGVRNCVIQIRRYSEVDSWRHVESALNPADIGTRPCEVKEVMQGSAWQVGYDWMTLQQQQMPIKTVQEVTLSKEDKVSVAKEIRNSDIQGIILTNLVSKVSERYSFSRYLTDPCGQPWAKFLRRLAVLCRIVRSWRSKTRKFEALDDKLIVSLDDADYDEALKYLFQVTTKEVQHFNEDSKLKEGKLVDGILRYSGRILEGHKPDNVARVMIDVKPFTFFNPILDRYSPVSYSIMTYAHVTATFHGGIKNTLRASRDVAYILQADSLAAEIKKNCRFCQKFKAKRLEAEMAKVHPSRYTIAPAFYCSQADLFGPFSASCAHGRKSTIKVYGVVFKCSTTMACAAFVMQAYDTENFVDVFYRFGSRYGYPNHVYIDQGSQIMAACKKMDLSIVDLTKTINRRMRTKVSFKTCPAGSHNFIGGAERAVGRIKELFNLVFGGLKMDVLHYETAFCYVTNELNSMPMCLGKRYTNLDELDLITPARLLLGRNNRRAPADQITLAPGFRMLKHMELIEKSWWKVWENQKIADYIPALKKWSSGRPDISVEDVVVFTRDTGVQLGGVTWRVGTVSEVNESHDGVVRSVMIKYRLTIGGKYQFTKRSVREIAILEAEDDLDLPGQLSEAVKKANIHLTVSTA